jgi:hypothetical protein
MERNSGRKAFRGIFSPEDRTMSDVPLKECSLGHLAPAWEFYKDSRYADGLYPKCKYHKAERVNWSYAHPGEPYDPSEFPPERARENRHLAGEEATRQHGASPEQPSPAEKMSSLQHQPVEFEKRVELERIWWIR